MVLEWWAYREGDSGSLTRALELALEGLRCAAPDSRMYLESYIAGWSLALGRARESVPHARLALMLAVEARDAIITAQMVAYSGAAAVDRDPEQAALLLGYAKARLDELQWEAHATDKAIVSKASDAITNAIGDTRFNALLEEGAAWTERDAQTAAMFAVNNEEELSSSVVRR
jgi:hypothetical protein